VHDDDGRRHDLEFDLSGPRCSGDALLAATLLPAMWTCQPLSLSAPVSGRLAAAADQIQDIVLTWDKALRPGAPAYRRVVVGAPTGGAPPPPGRGVACFFTAGVDSFFSILRHRDQIDALVFVSDFDGVDPGAPPRPLAADVQQAADELGLPLVHVRSNLRRFAAEQGVHWLDFHGSALASVAHLLGGQFHTVLVSATTTYAELYPLGSHPMLDPLWSSEDVTLVHDGGEASRVEKLAALAELPAARRWLRVCWKDGSNAENCGRCEKCLRTMVGLRIAGVADRFSALPPLRLSDVARVKVPGLGTTWSGYLAQLEATGADPPLERALRTALWRKRLASVVPERRRSR